MSTNTKFAIENSEGPLDPEQLVTLIKMVSEQSPGQVLLCFNNYTRDAVEKIKKQLEDIPTAIRDNAKNQKKMDDRLIKRIQKFIETVEKLRLQPSNNRQSQLPEFFVSQSQGQMLGENSNSWENSEDEGETNM